VLSDDDFAIFQNSGYMGLYGGMTVADIHASKGLKKKTRKFSISWEAQS
jgi:DNA-damage-inducible protein D